VSNEKIVAAEKDPAATMICFYLISYQFEISPAVFSSACIGIIIGDWLVRTISDYDKTIGRHPVGFDQIISY